MLPLKRMTSRIPGRRASRALIAVAVAGGLFVAAQIVLRSTGAGESSSGLTSIFACVVATVVIVWAGVVTVAWEETLPFAVAMAAAAGARLIVIFDTTGSARDASRIADPVYLVVCGLFLVPVMAQFRKHFRREDRREIVADIGLIAVSLITVIYVLLRPTTGTEQVAALAWSALFAVTAGAAIASYTANALWIPSVAHVGRLIVAADFASVTLLIGSAWIGHTDAWGAWNLDLMIGLGALALAATAVLFPGAETTGHIVSTEGALSRGLLTAGAITAAAASLAAIPILEKRGDATIPEASLLIAILAAAIATRIIVNQIRSAHVRQANTQALAEKEAALLEASEAMTWLREAIDTLTMSEQRLRLLFDAAVDGVVELDADNVIRRTNEAFCAMVELEEDQIVGRGWEEFAELVRGGGSSLRTLPVTGEATIMRREQKLSLEARASTIPGNPPGRLLLVRDITAAKVADQTIRSLFQFLQDRDEDRTRILKRTNSAIESERNRVARDLHDGPVQGVSAASLSLEAVLLMLKNGDVERAMDTLVKVRNQLSEEADSLRRLMSNLRPPLLEERGLVPALKETLARFGREENIKTHFRSRSLVDLPADLETLAYRLVQEALSNARKHSQATELTVSVDAVAGQLRVTVEDNGVGFDTTRARDFLRMGKVGLASMRERIELANGTFMVNSSPRTGTAIVAILPLESTPATPVQV
jgi:PAS domain S-box-containing protein